MIQKTIVLVEDEFELQELICEFLTDAGYHVFCAQDGNSALAILEERAGQADLIMTDVTMPHIDGNQLTKLVRQKWSDIPFVYMSGHSREAVRQSKDVHFLEKPFTMTRLLELVEKAMFESAGQ